MFDLLKLSLLVAGCVAVYGITTGADLNVLFNEVLDKAVPTIHSALAAIWQLLKDAIAK
jgi:hypothetical protein